MSSRHLMAGGHIEPRERARPLPPGYHGRTLAFSLLDTLGRALVLGTYGETFPSECELAREYGVSLSVMREATKMLAAKGLLCAAHQRGTVIIPGDQWNLFDPDVLRWLAGLKEPVSLLRQLRELCVTVEPEAAALAACHAVPAQVDEIAARLERMEKAGTGGTDRLRAGLDFQLAVLGASNNPFFVQCGDVVTAAFTAAMRCSRIDGPQGGTGHGSTVYASIAAGDADGARRAMRHLVGETLGRTGKPGRAQAFD